MIALLSVAILVMDQASKTWAVQYLSDRDPIKVLGDLLRFNHTTNSGAAFNIGADLTVFLTVFALVVATGLIIFARRVVEIRWSIGFGILLGGVLGNLTDRIFREPRLLHGHVVDFIELPHWPIFNIADIAITTAGLLIFSLLWRDIRPYATFEGGYGDRPADPPSEAFGDR